MLRAMKLAAVIGCFVGLGAFAFADDQTSHGMIASAAQADFGVSHAADDHDGSDHGHGSHATDGHEHGGAHDHGHGGSDDHGAGAHGGEDGHGDAHGGHGNTHPLSFDIDLALFTILVFSLTYLVMSKFAWKPIRAALDKRDAFMASQLKEARERHEEAERLRKEHAAQLASAGEEVRHLLDAARKDAETEKQSILDAAQMAAAAEKEQALAAIGAARGDALEDLANRSVDTAVGLAGRIVGRPLNSSDHTGLIDDAVKRFTDATS